MKRLKDLLKTKERTNQIFAGYCVGDFTKRQGNIMAFILLLSRQNKEYIAHVPELCDFEYCGVSRTKVKEELVKLEKANVLKWNREEMLFQINHNADEWKVKPTPLFNKDRLQKLIELNDDC
ncbi:hypothetical protein ABIC37_005414 [Priestia megaterium]|uniref:replication protein n=1 Tax=Priestia megaterium TaxID=1404 RepID=UPI003399A385